MSDHDVFTGSAGMAGASDGWTHTAPDSLPRMGGDPARYLANRHEDDPSHPVVLFLMVVLCVATLAALTRPALALALSLLEWLGWLP